MPAALVTAMTSIALKVGANRIVAGVRIPYPLGDPTLPAEREKALRRGIVTKALQALKTEVEGRNLLFY